MNRPAVAFLLLFAGAAASLALRPADVRVVRLGSDRNTPPYSEPWAREKAILLARINGQRREAGVRPLAYCTRAARAGDLFCREAAEKEFSGHWDLEGRPPYLRWALAGGVDAHAENFSSRTRTPGPLDEPMENLLLDAHARFMAERPPHDGHRRTVLDPAFTCVGIGAAIRGGEFRMTEEFVRQALDWVEIPYGPVPAGTAAPFAARMPIGWNVAAVEVGFEPPPRPMTREENARREAYPLPEAYRKLRAFAPSGSVWTDGTRGDFAVATGGILRLSIPLDRGRGSYWLLVYAGEGNVIGRSLTPVTLARVVAE